MTIQEQAEALNPWYHEIELEPGYFTKSNMLESKPQWENNQRVRQLIGYRGKTVFDIGCMDGMWAFQAESLGAGRVIAGDVFQRNKDSLKRFKLARSALRSHVELVCPIDVHLLDKTFFLETMDIVQCLGVLYHVQNPQLALHQIRGIMKDGGQLLLETAVFNSDTDAPMMRYNSDRVVYDDASSYWFPNWRCLQDMLKCAGFSPRTETAGWVKGGHASRVCMVCDAAPIPVHEDNFGGCQS